MTRRSLQVVALLLVISGRAAAQQPVPPPRDLPHTQAPVGAGVITGIVRAADTGAPVRGADIRLSSPGPGRGLRGAITDATGRYEFTGLPDGQYTLIASKVRYMTMTYGQTRAGEDGRPVLLTNGQRVENIDFALPAGSAIVLRVTDRFGDPAIGFRVNLYQAKFSAGRRTLAPVSQLVSSFGSATDDRGEIRLSGLPPGEYYVSAGGGAGARPGMPASDQDVQTFYPGTAAEADAQAITVGLGEEVVAAFNTASSRSARLSGTIVGASESPQVRLGRRMIGSGLSLIDVNVGPDGRFSAANLPPGDYEMTALTAAEIGALRLSITGDDVSGVVLTMRPAVPLHGKATFEGTPPAGIPQQTFTLRPELAETLGLPAVARYKPDWTFEMPALVGSGVLRGDLPRGWFLKSVRLDGRDVTDTVLDFQTYEGKQIEVVFTQTMAAIGGRVLDAAGRDVANYVAVVFPEDQQRWTPLTRSIAKVRPDQQGRFSIRGLPPGRYLVRAVESLASGSERDPGTLERLRAGATAVTLKDQESANVTLRLPQ